MKTKRGMVDELVKQAVRAALADLALSSPALAETLRANEGCIKLRVVMNIVWDNYRWLELCDIMAWRKRAIEDKSTD